MSDLRQCNTEFLTAFIELYKSFPCLWQIKSKEYRDKALKNNAYEQLIKLFKEVDSKANREMVAKKINSLRTVYKKELIKVRNSELTGDIYTPTLWYFSLFSFLEDQERGCDQERGSPRVPRPTFEVKEESLTAMDQGSADYEYCEDQELADTSSNPGENSICQYPSQYQWGSRKRKGSEDQVVEPVSRAERGLASEYPEDWIDRYGKHIADRLRRIKPHQIKFIQKLVSDVLFEGELETLNKNWKLVEMIEPK
ncbi:hypothetical protein GE061_014691 [Apolygus lucorum]|uniref:MADF domain-containing protein n=1 Tax=Apolygus lucorum TaxID=248454 RepID=A0A8S9XL19_APOLU|nr:hypothetical protein GE061_014691 [Apolygus lucorum]